MKIEPMPQFMAPDLDVVPFPDGLDRDGRVAWLVDEHGMDRGEAERVVDAAAD